MQNEFKKQLAEQGLSYCVHYNDCYYISSHKNGVNHIVVQLISSLPVNKQIHSSKNGNVIQAIGRFRFKFPSSGREPDILSFAFQNTVKNRVEFLIIPLQEFLRRHVKKNPGINPTKFFEMTIWLMEDLSAYDVTNISLEGEWFFLGKGRCGRMADESEYDYSGFMNNWDWITDR